MFILLYFVIFKKCSRKLRKLQIANCGTKKTAGNKPRRPSFFTAKLGFA